MGAGSVDFDRGLLRLASYARTHGHANPKSDEVWLEWTIGLWVRSLREKFRADKLTDEQIAAAKALGVRFIPPYRDPKPKPPTRAQRQESEFLVRLDRLRGFYHKYGHINVGQLHGSNEWTGAGRWIARIRCLYRQGRLSPKVIKVAEELNIDWNPGPGARTYLKR